MFLMWFCSFGVSLMNALFKYKHFLIVIYCSCFPLFIDGFMWNGEKYLSGRVKHLSLSLPQDNETTDLIREPAPMKCLTYSLRLISNWLLRLFFKHLWGFFPSHLFVSEHFVAFGLKLKVNPVCLDKNLLFLPLNRFSHKKCPRRQWQTRFQSAV